MSGKFAALCREIAERASEALGCGAEEIFHMTPAELDSRVRAEREARFRRAQELDLLAWLTGQYAAVALNRPDSYPRRPDRVARRAQDDAAMKGLLKRLARREEGDELGS